MNIAPVVKLKIKERLKQKLLEKGKWLTTAFSTLIFVLTTGFVVVKLYHLVQLIQLLEFMLYGVHLGSHLFYEEWLVARKQLGDAYFHLNVLTVFYFVFLCLFLYATLKKKRLKTVTYFVVGFLSGSLIVASVFAPRFFPDYYAGVRAGIKADTPFEFSEVSGCISVSFVFVQQYFVYFKLEARTPNPTNPTLCYYWVSGGIVYEPSGAYFCIEWFALGDYGELKSFEEPVKNHSYQVKIWRSGDNWGCEISDGDKLIISKTVLLWLPITVLYAGFWCGEGDDAGIATFNNLQYSINFQNGTSISQSWIPNDYVKYSIVTYPDWYRVYISQFYYSFNAGRNVPICYRIEGCYYYHDDFLYAVFYPMLERKPTRIVLEPIGEKVSRMFW